VNGTAYGFSGLTNQVITLNLTHGQTSFVSNIDPAVGLVAGASPAAVPEPGSIVLTAVGLVVVASYWRRKRSAHCSKCSSFWTYLRGRF